MTLHDDAKHPRGDNPANTGQFATTPKGDPGTDVIADVPRYFAENPKVLAALGSWVPYTLEDEELLTAVLGGQHRDKPHYSFNAELDIYTDARRWQTKHQFHNYVGRKLAGYLSDTHGEVMEVNMVAGSDGSIEHVDISIPVNRPDGQVAFYVSDRLDYRRIDRPNLNLLAAVNTAGRIKHTHDLLRNKMERAGITPAPAPGQG